MRLIGYARTFAIAVTAAAPFVLLPRGLAVCVEPMARVGARWLNVVVPDLTMEFAGASVAAADPAPPSPMQAEPAAPHADVPAAARSNTGRHAAAVSRAVRRVFVGPESVQRALPIAGRPTSTWTNPTVQHPAGLLIESPGVLSGTLEPGDILVEAEGERLSTLEQLVVTVRRAYERRSARLSGRLFRKGELIPITVEPGW